MPTYISLINWTDQGIRTFGESLNRAEVAKQAAQRLGGTLTETYWTVGAYDIVAVSEFPDDESGTAFLLQLGALGNVRTTTLRAFDSDEMARVLDKLG
ncbi:GYD domain-containing protein [Actinocatenispora rupis]|uniref:GYD domain-containing protein n=1 Tax=Actinocatenispora rupis TaxID=519421 RepID=A0A8J3IZJ8_9ACTN|nr:GYD domain-containing protein [Actinocatenispora rupis]GID09280.1 GYD domain-containing protein [Actinocatenispora rupis]